MNSNKSISYVLLLSAFVTACSGSGGGATSTAVPQDFTQDLRSQAKSVPASQEATDFLAVRMKQESKVMPTSDVIFDISGSKSGKQKEYAQLDETGRKLADQIWGSCVIKPETSKQTGDYAAGAKVTVTSEKNVTGADCPVQISESTSNETSVSALDPKTGEASFAGVVSSRQTIRVTDSNVIATGSLAAATIETKGTTLGERLIFSSGVVTAGHGYSAGEFNGSFDFISGGKKEKVTISGKTESVHNSTGTRMQTFVAFDTAVGPVKMFSLSVKDPTGKAVPEKSELIVNGQSYTSEQAIEKFGTNMGAFGN